jgi:hypothetical protein
MDKTDDLPIRVYHPQALGTWTIEAQRLDLGEGYKPSLALLPDGELVLVSLDSPDNAAPGTFAERMPLRRSADGGRTWTDPVIAADVIGREQWLTCTRDGTLFVSSHLLEQDANNHDGITHSYLHRSTDGGRTWARTKILIEGEARGGEPPEKTSHTSRNVVERSDGTLLFGVSLNDTSVAYLWRSTDGGLTWDTSQRVDIGDYGERPYDNFDGFFCEDFTYLTQQGDLIHWVRCGPPSPMFPIEDGRAVPYGNDNVDRTLVCRSMDGGRTWSSLADFGDYGKHYIRPLRLADGRLLVTYTQRSTFFPLGLRALVSHDDGDTWDFLIDQILIEGRTSWGLQSGGGFGNTVQLADGELLSCYSYRDAGNQTRIEVVRWRLP